jgi:hypothetical protein
MDLESARRADYYKRRAADARVKAYALHELEARNTMLQLARLWDKMAATAQLRSQSSPTARVPKS